MAPNTFCYIRNAHIFHRIFDIWLKVYPNIQHFVFSQNTIHDISSYKYLPVIYGAIPEMQVKFREYVFGNVTRNGVVGNVKEVAQMGNPAVGLGTHPVFQGRLVNPDSHADRLKIARLFPPPTARTTKTNLDVVRLVLRLYPDGDADHLPVAPSIIRVHQHARLRLVDRGVQMPTNRRSDLLQRRTLTRNRQHVCDRKVQKHSTQYFRRTTVMQMAVLRLNADVAQIVVSEVAAHHEDVCVVDEQQELAVLAGDHVSGRIANWRVQIQEASSDVQVEGQVALRVHFHGDQLRFLPGTVLVEGVEDG